MMRLKTKSTKIKIKRSIRAISPVLATLMMIAIAVAASLVAYAWIMGYIGGTTAKTGKAVQVQSMAIGTGVLPNDPSDDKLVVYVQNVGQGAVTIGSVYVNDTQQTFTSDKAGNKLNDGETATLTIDFHVVSGDKVKVKVVTTDGTFTESPSTNLQISGGGGGGTTPALDHFTFNAISTTQTVNVAFGITIAAIDQFGAAFSYSGPGTVTDLSGTVNTGVTFSSGGATGSVTVTIAYPSDRILVNAGGKTGQSNLFNVEAPAGPTLDHFNIATVTSPQIAGTPYSITVTAIGSDGNTLTSYVGNPALSSSSWASNQFLGAFSSGTKTGPVTSTIAGSTSISVADGSHTGASNSFTVNAGALHHFTITAQGGGSIGTQTVNVAYSITVTAKDANGNTVTGYIGNPALTSSSWVGNLYLVAFVGGTQTGSVTSTAVVTSTSITATDGLVTGLPSNTFDVVAGLAVNIAPSGSLGKDVGQTQLFTATATGGIGSRSYQWYLDDVVVPLETASTYTYNVASGLHTVYVKVTDSALPPVTVQSNTVSITGNALPTASILPISWTMDVGQSKQFSATGADGTLPYTGYQWYVGGVAQVGATGQTFTYDAVAEGSASITVTVTDSAGITSVQSPAATVTINSALVAPTATATPSTVDQGQTSTLSVSVTTGTSPYTYQWEWQAPGGSMQQISGANSATYDFVTTGSTTIGDWKFDVIVTDAAGATVTSTPLATVTVNTAPTVSITPIGPLTMNPNDIQRFTAAPSGGTGQIHYHWYLDNVPVGLDSITYDYTASSGLHTVNCTITDSATTPVTSPGSNKVSITVAPFGLDGSQWTSTVTSNTMTITLATSYDNDVLYLSFVGGGSTDISSISSTGGTSAWTQRAYVAEDSTHHLSTWYATWASHGTTTITITLNGGGSGTCAAVAFGISGANTAVPFDGAVRTNAGYGTTASVSVTTSNANDFIIGAFGVEGTATLTPNSTMTLIRTQTAGSSRQTSDEYTVVSSTLSGAQVRYTWSGSDYWAIVADAIQKAGTGTGTGTFGYTPQGANTGNGNLEDYMLGSIFTSPGTSVTAQSITAYIQVTSTHTIKAAIYTLSGSTGTLVVGTSEVSVTTSNDGWVTFTITGGQALAASTNYLLVVWANNPTGSATLYSDTSGGAGRYDSITYATNWPTSNTFTSTTVGNYDYSIYCTYTIP